MTACAAPRFEELDALVHAELETEAEVALLAHLEGCAACARELALLRAERTALKSRPLPSPIRVVAMRPVATPPGLRAIRERARKLQSRDRVAGRRSVLFAALGAAAALLVAVQGGPHLTAAAHATDAISADDGAELSSNFPWCGDRLDPVRTLESAFSACLTATPRALPGSPAVCL